MKLGFLGTGHITSAMVTGLGTSDHRIWLSPRNAATAQDLARRFPHVTVASSNQDVIDETDVVVLALPPGAALDVLANVRFRADSQIISLISGLAIKPIADLVQPATNITRAVPLPSVADRAGPTAIFPSNGTAIDLFDSIGMAIPVDREDQFEAFCAATATIASHLAFSDAVASWLVGQGIADTQAHEYVRAMMRGVINGVADAEAHATPGGTNEHLLRHLERHGVFEHIAKGLDSVLHR